MNLGENIYRLRTQKNMSQGDLADALEVSRQSVSKWENNSAVPELDKLKKMSQLFQITLDELINGEPTPKAEPAPPATVYIQKRSPMPFNRLFGIILLVCGLVFFIGLTVLGCFIGYPPLGLLIALPFVINGIICLLANKHTLFVVCWVNYILLFLFVFAVTMSTVEGSVDPTVIISAVLLAGLVAWSPYKLYKGHFNAGRIARILWTVILVLLLVGHLLLVPVSQGGGRVVTDEYTVEEYISME